MFKELANEYISFFGIQRFALLRGIVCYYRVPKFRVVVLIRRMQNTKSFLIKRRLQKKLKFKYTVDIGINAKIGNHFWVEHYNGIVIGDGVTIGEYCTLYQNVTLGQKNGRYPKVCDRVTIYPGAIILGNITIGQGSAILAGSVVIKNVVANSMIGGNPGKIKMSQLQEGDS